MYWDIVLESLKTKNNPLNLHKAEDTKQTYEHTLSLNVLDCFALMVCHECSWVQWCHPEGDVSAVEVGQHFAYN